MYHLNPELRKITSLISVRIHRNPEKAIAFGNGNELVDYAFDKPYTIEKIYQDLGFIVVELTEKELNGTNWIGEEQVSFF